MKGKLIASILTHLTTQEKKNGDILTTLIIQKLQNGLTKLLEWKEKTLLVMTSGYV